MEAGWRACVSEIHFCSFFSFYVSVLYAGKRKRFVSFYLFRLTDSALMIHGIVVVFVVRPARLAADRLRVSHLLLLLGGFFSLVLVFFFQFAGFGTFRLVVGVGLTLGHHWSLLALLTGAFGGSLATWLLARLAVRGGLRFRLLLAVSLLLAVPLLAVTLLLAVRLLIRVLRFLWLLSIAILVLLAILVFALQLLVIGLLIWLAVTLALTLLAVVVRTGLLPVLLLLLATVLRHPFGKLGLKDQVTG